MTTIHYLPSRWVAEPADTAGLTAVTIRRTIRRRIEARMTGDYGTVTYAALMGDEHDGTRPVADAVAFAVSGMNVRHTPPSEQERRQVSRARRLDVRTGEQGRLTGDLTVTPADGDPVTIRQHHYRLLVREAYRIEAGTAHRDAKARYRDRKRSEQAARRAEREAEHNARLAARRAEREAAQGHKAQRDRTTEWAG